MKKISAVYLNDIKPYEITDQATGKKFKRKGLVVKVCFNDKTYREMFINERDIYHAVKNKLDYELLK